MWNGDEVFSPSRLKRYQDCPERYWLQYVKRVKRPYVAAVAVERGNAVHKAMHGVALYYKYHGRFPSDLAERVAPVLVKGCYESEEAWSQDVEAIVKEVEFAMGQLDGDAEVLASEVTYYFPYEQGRGCPPFTLSATVDLVLRRTDEHGAPFLDVVDFKSGEREIDPIQEMACRTVVRHNMNLLGGSYDKIRNTTVYTSSGAVHSVFLDQKDVNERWKTIKGIVSAIHSGSNWQPSQSPLCPWCPYFADGCSLAPSRVGAKELGDELDGVES